MTRLTRYIESRGFWLFVGALLALLILSKSYRGIVAKERPDNITPMREAV